ncbi:hypothetical protein, partial [Marinobacter sp. SS5-14b]|uniref:hypothetical protein n=1 Tax=Marinobacter sp. SS5-14b TaxID=3050456 RepID=UPI0026E0BE5A
AGCFLFELRRKRTSLSGHQTPRLWWRSYHLRWCPESLNHYTALKILETVTSHREFIEVLKRMGKDGVKGDFNDLRTNYAILMFQRLFKSQQSAKTEEWLRNLYG